MTLSTEGIAGSFCFALKVKSGLKNIWFIGSTLIQTALLVTKFCQELTVPRLLFNLQRLKRPIVILAVAVGYGAYCTGKEGNDVYLHVQNKKEREINITDQYPASEGQSHVL